MFFWDKWLRYQKKGAAHNALEIQQRTYHIYDEVEPSLEIQSIKNMTHCLEEMPKIAKFSEEHWTGAGWSDIYVREPLPYKLESLGISLEEIRNHVTVQMPEYEKVFVHGFHGGAQSSCVHAFGAEGKEDAFFVTINQDRIIMEISSQNAGNFLFLLPRKEQLVLLDWTKYECIPLSDEARIKQYLDAD